MPAPSKYPSAHEQLLHLARIALRDGLTFERFWELAVRPGKSPVTWHTLEARRPARCVIWPRDTVDRRLSIAATNASREGWRRAYDGVPPTPEERALRLLAPLMASVGDGFSLELFAMDEVAELPPEQLVLAVSVPESR